MKDSDSPLAKIAHWLNYPSVAVALMNTGTVAPQAHQAPTSPSFSPPRPQSSVLTIFILIFIFYMKLLLSNCFLSSTTFNSLHISHSHLSKVESPCLLFLSCTWWNFKFQIAVNSVQPYGSSVHPYGPSTHATIWAKHACNHMGQAHACNHMGQARMQPSGSSV